MSIWDSNGLNPMSFSSVGAGSAAQLLAMLPEGATATTLLPRDFSLGSITTATSATSTATTASQDEFYKTRDHAERTLQRMQNYLDSQQLCDVTLVAGIDGRK